MKFGSINTLFHNNVRKITEYEYNLVEMQQLDNKIELEESQSAYATSIRLLEKELRIYDIELKTLSPATPPSREPNATDSTIFLSNSKPERSCLVRLTQHMTNTATLE